MATWADWLAQHRDELNHETPYEWTFANLVLARVPGLTPEAVGIQEPFKDENGRPRRMDFALHKASMKIAIEVDGYDKTGSGTGMNREQFTDFLLRQTSLAAQGWTVLRFDNSYFTRHPKRCVRQIELALRSAGQRQPEEARELQELRTESNADAQQAVRAAEERAVAAETRATEAQRRAGRAEQESAASRRTRNAVIGWSVVAVVVAGVGAAVYANSRSDGQLGVPASNGQCSQEAPIKGNRSQRTSERIYHLPKQQFYDSTTAIRCFVDEDQAAQAGYRKSKR